MAAKKLGGVKTGVKFVPVDLRYTAAHEDGLVWKLRPWFPGIRWNCITTDGNHVGDFPFDLMVEEVQENGSQKG